MEQNKPVHVIKKHNQFQNTIICTTIIVAIAQAINKQ